MLPCPLVRELQMQESLQVELFDDTCISGIVEDLMTSSSTPNVFQGPYAILIGPQSGLRNPAAKFYPLDVSAFQNVVVRHHVIFAKIVPWTPPPTTKRFMEALKRAASPLRHRSPIPNPLRSRSPSGASGSGTGPAGRSVQKASVQRERSPEPSKQPSKTGSGHRKYIPLPQGT